MPKERRCERCGKLLTNPKSQAKYCKPCRELIHKEQWANVLKNNTNRSTNTGAKHYNLDGSTTLPQYKGPSVEEITKRADELGMSYGKYVLKYGSRIV